MEEDGIVEKVSEPSMSLELYYQVDDCYDYMPRWLMSLQAQCKTVPRQVSSLTQALRT